MEWASDRLDALVWLEDDALEEVLDSKRDRLQKLVQTFLQLKKKGMMMRRGQEISKMNESN